MILPANLDDRDAARHIYENLDIPLRGGHYNIFGFLSTMHTAFSRRGPETQAARLWGYYNELAAWAFVFMTVSGLYLWLDTMPGMRWAQLLAASSIGFSIVLWLVTV